MKKPLPRKLPAKAAAPAPEPEAVEANGRTVTLTRGFTMQTADGQFAKASVSITGPVDEVDEIREQVSELASTEMAASVDQLREFAWDNGGVEADDDDTDVGEDPDVIAADEDDIGPDQIRAMKRPQLISLIEENGLDLDPDDFPKNPTGLTKLREAIIEIATAEDDGDEGADETGDEGDEITVEQINAMTRPQLIKLIKDNEIEVDPAPLTKLADLRAAVIEALDDGDGDSGGDDDGDDSGDEGDQEAYTREDLTAYSLDDLKAIYVEWELGKFPTGPAPVAKKNAITAILKAQAG